MNNTKKQSKSKLQKYIKTNKTYKTRIKTRGKQR